MTDWRKYRKSTHLASADIDAMETDGVSLVFTIKEVKYETGVNVSGTKMDGIFCYFEQPVKALKLNSTNCNVLAGFTGLAGKERHEIERWAGLKIELYVDRAVKFKGVITDGVRIAPVKPQTKIKPIFTEANFAAAKKAGATREQIEQHYTLNEEIWKQFNLG